MRLPRKHETITWSDKSTEVRSKPLIVWLIDKWFLWAHEWPWLFLHRMPRFLWPFCTAYDIYVAPWSNGYDRIDNA